MISREEGISNIHSGDVNGKAAGVSPFFETMENKRIVVCSVTSSESILIVWYVSSCFGPFSDSQVNWERQNLQDTAF
jgi:hypothetical protein